MFARVCATVTDGELCITDSALNKYALIQICVIVSHLDLRVDESNEILNFALLRGPTQEAMTRNMREYKDLFL